MISKAVGAALVVSLLVVSVFSAATASGEPLRPVLEARAVMPADTFAPGPVSGQFITGGLRPHPFPSQPVQGISAVLEAEPDSYWVMEDNGYGAKENSADFLLRMYHVTPHWETAAGGSGTVSIGDYIQLHDSDHKVPWPIVNDATVERALTGADFDIESVRRAKDGTLWFGDEFGPFLVHTDASGKVLEAPFAVPGVKSPQNPTLAPGEAPNLPRSRGLEGMAISKDGKTLYPMLEGALTTDADQRRRFIYELDLETETFTGRRWQVHFDQAAYSLGDLTALDEHRLLMIERDPPSGPAAQFKRIFVLDLRDVGSDGFLVKRQVVDLLDIADSNLISLPARPGDFGLGDPFKFPFETIESVLPLDGERLLLINDNNYPFSAGRNPTLPDDDEFIVVRAALH
jgi:glycerophosphoryl diester phosphodiesterase